MFRGGQIDRAVKIWKALLIVYRELDLKLTVEGKRSRFHWRAPENEISDALESFAALPPLATDLSGGKVTLATQIIDAKHPLRSLSRRAENEYWPSPDDTRRDLAQFAPAGTFDSLFAFWPQHDFAGGVSVPGYAWGLGMGASEWSNGATYAVVANAPASAWRNEVPGEVWLHEWLHGVCHHFAQLGHPMPARDADGAENHGYVRSPEEGWCEYYRDLMNGAVAEKGRAVGIPSAAWV